MKSPLLFLTFNRLEVAVKVFSRIREAKPNRLYLASDGPRDFCRGEDKKVQEVRETIMSMVDWSCELKTLFRSNNLGCGKAVSEAVSWFLSQEEEGVILEDDCYPSHSFFRFCDEMLDTYRDHSDVLHVGGTNPLTESKASDTYYFSRYNRIWGWATWRRAWEHFDLSIEFWPSVKEDGRLHKILGKYEAEHYSRLFDLVHSGKIDTWDYQWFLCRLLNGLALIPKANLVSNLGFNSEATHTLDSDSPLSNLELGVMEFPLRHPLKEVDLQLDKAWAALTPSQVSLWKKVIRKLGMK